MVEDATAVYCIEERGEEKRGEAGGGAGGDTDTQLCEAKSNPRVEMERNEAWSGEVGVAFESRGLSRGTLWNLEVVRLKLVVVGGKVKVKRKVGTAGEEKLEYSSE